MSRRCACVLACRWLSCYPKLKRHVPVRPVRVQVGPVADSLVDRGFSITSAQALAHRLNQRHHQLLLLHPGCLAAILPKSSVCVPVSLLTRLLSASVRHAPSRRCAQTGAGRGVLGACAVHVRARLHHARPSAAVRHQRIGRDPVGADTGRRRMYPRLWPSP